MEEKPLVWRGKEWILEMGFEEQAEKRGVWVLKKCLCEELANGIAKELVLNMFLEPIIQLWLLVCTVKNYT